MSRDIQDIEADVVAPRPTRLRTLLGVAMSLVAVTACVVWATRQETPDFPSTPGHLALLVAAVTIYAAATVIRGWRWHRILRLAKIDHELADCLSLTAVGYMGNTVLPARGGEVLRIVLMRERSRARRREILGSIVAERGLDAGALMVLFALMTVLNVGASPTGRTPGLLAGASLVLSVVLALVYLRVRAAGRLESFAAKLKPVTHATRQLLTPTGIALAMATSVVWIGEGAIFWLVARSLDIHLALLDAVLVVVLASAAALIPAAPGYVGTYDAAVLFALSHLDVAGSAAVGAALLFRFVIFVPITLVGLVLIVARYGGLRRALRFTARSSPPDAPAGSS